MKRQVIVVLEYDDEQLTPGGIMRCEPSNVKELIEEVERNNNATESFYISLKLIHEVPK